MNPCAMLIASSLLLSGSHTTGPQSRPDFSGTWRLVEYRIGDKVTPTPGGMVSGAAVNCGERCTITQAADRLTVSRIPSQGAAKSRDEVVFLDGRPMANQATVTWSDAKLSLVRSFVNIVVTQTFSLDGGKLIVAATLNTGNVGPYTLTYERTSKLTRIQ